MKQEDLQQLKRRANTYRENENLPSYGAVVFFEYGIWGWIDSIRNPETFRPGCIALLINDSVYQTTGGNKYDGARSWDPVTVTP